MIRFGRKTPKTTTAKKTTEKGTKQTMFQKILTAEGWKRLMMGKSKGKKK